MSTQSAWDPTKSTRSIGARLWSGVVWVLGIVLGLIVVGLLVIFFRAFVSSGNVGSSATNLLAVLRRGFQVAGQPTIGPDNAPVTIVAFEDFECPYCKQAEPILKRVLTANPTKVRLVYLDYPLTEIHPKAFMAAVAGQCAHKQGKFWPYHDLLYARSPQLSEQQLLQYAAEVGLSVADMQTCLRQNSAQSAVHADIQQGKQIGLTATPNFFINGIQYEGVLSFEQFQAIIDAEVAGQKK